MKKLYIATILAFAAMATSCSMEEEPSGVINSDVAIGSVHDCEQYVNSLYAGLRARTAGSYIAYPELAVDNFQATIINGNRGASFANGTILPSDQDITGIYQNMYIAIASCNFFIDNAEALIAKGELKDSELLKVNKMIGEAKFARGYYYWYLFDKFCPTYTKAIGDDEAKGLQLAFHYFPTSDRSKYPGRSTLNQTLEAIKADLADAYTALKAYEDDGHLDYCVPNATRLSSYVVLALQSRLALQTGEYADAVKYATSVIESGNYDLATRANYTTMWTNDQSTELLFVPYGSISEPGPATGSIWLTNSSQQSSDFIPASNVLDFLPATDIRRRAFISTYELNNDGAYTAAPVFIKFPGNSTLYNETNNLSNKPKPFRLSELYLIIAEASDKLGNETDANSYLNKLAKNRIVGYKDVNLSGDALTNAIRLERNKELIGEGFRLSDLRRWGHAFTRQCDYTGATFSETLNLLYSNTRNLSYSANDYRYVWPIPQDEMTVNPQLHGQQNSGY